MPAIQTRVSSPVGESTTAQHVDTADTAERPSPLAPPLGQARRYSVVITEQSKQEAARYMALRAEMQEIMAQPNVSQTMLDRWKALSTESNTLAHAFIGVMELRFQAATPLPG